MDHRWYAYLVKTKIRIQLISNFVQSRKTPDSPVLFVNSFPKSGTNLLVQILNSLSTVGHFSKCRRGNIATYHSQTGRKRTEGEIITDLKRLFAGEVANGHLHAFPGVINYLKKRNLIHFFIFRDLRDIVVSHAYYVTEINTDHIHHRYYRYVLSDMENRIETSILGIPDSPLDFPDIGTRFLPYLPWLQQPDVIPIRFEELIQDPELNLQKILNVIQDKIFVFKADREEVLNRMRSGMAPEQSRTFRKGTSGDWKKTLY